MRIAESHLGSSFVPPSESLIRLIRSGKLTDVGYATPILVSDLVAGKVGGSTVSTLGTNDDGAVRITDSIRAPPIRDIQQFTSTIISTIIPALIDNPAAIIDWCTLLRTALQLNADRGWPTAKDYIDQVLTHSVHQRKPFGPIVPTILSSVFNQSHRGSVASSSNAPTGGLRSGGQPKRPCFAWNEGRCTTRECRFSHVCSKCESGSHTSAACPSGKPAPVDPRGRSGGGGRPMRSERGNGRGGGRARASDSFGPDASSEGKAQ